MVVPALACAAALIATAALAVMIGGARRGSDLVYGASLVASLALLLIAVLALLGVR